MTSRQIARALILIAGLGLVTYYEQQSWTGNAALWSRHAQTVRAHVNARQAYLDSGHIFEAIDECTWLFHAVDTGQATRWQVRDISRICVRSPR